MALAVRVMQSSALWGLVTLLSACPSQGPALEPPAIEGQVVFPEARSPYTTQATLSEVANAATVVLIDTTANLTRGSTVTDATGRFSMRFSNSFRAVASASYYLEAFRGLGDNAVGKNAARLRTILRYDGGWQSLTSSVTGSPIYLNLGTTALAAIVNLKGPSRVSVDEAIGRLTVTPEVFTPFAGVTGPEFTAVKGIASSLLLADFDPLSGIVYEPGPPEAFLQRNNSSALACDQASASITDTITLRGVSFDPALPLSTSNVVLFNGTATGSVTSISADRQSINVVVPNEAITGPITVRTGDKIYGLPSFTVWSTVNVDLF